MKIVFEEERESCQLIDILFFFLIWRRNDWNDEKFFTSIGENLFYFLILNGKKYKLYIKFTVQKRINYKKNEIN